MIPLSGPVDVISHVKWKKSVDSSDPVIHTLSLNVYRDIKKKNTAWKEAAELFGYVSGGYVASTVSLLC